MHILLRHTHALILSYKNKEPFSSFAKSYFKKHPKLGSRDRKIISAFAFANFRVGLFIRDNYFDCFEDQLYWSICLVEQRVDYIRKFLPPQWQLIYEQNFEEARVRFTNSGRNWRIPNHFPELSASLSLEKWSTNHLYQADVFIRILSNYHDRVKQRLNAAEAIEEFPYCYRLPNGTPIQDILDGKTYVIQDKHSQKVMHQITDLKGSEEVWDVCAGAGGKLLQLIDRYPRITTLASDVRPGILKQLLIRFNEHQYPVPNMMVLDSSLLLMLKEKLGQKQFDFIIADVPCTGSGTWTRTPEHFYHFNNSEIKALNELQKSIMINATRYLNPGSHLLYITCSVFTCENEDVVNALIQHYGGDLSLIKSDLLFKYQDRSDALYYALIKKAPF